ncbi:CLUMA_CG002340, isoform A [Clunio marinus]|uniref:CLUMA_CG002340, isoform A n=1 Tax=Clunio marinus TaxID=568069 RepID=A0A1J1HKF1_9DIPT|nr:CLUMA_CG002340, isoform A [Clunio marinus]
MDNCDFFIDVLKREIKEMRHEMTTNRIEESNFENADSSTCRLFFLGWVTSLKYFLTRSDLTTCCDNGLVCVCMMCETLGRETDFN